MAVDRSRRAPLLIGGIVAFVVVLTGLAVAGTRHTGAATPTDAVQDFFATLDHGTVTDLLEQLPPAQADALADTLPDLATELGRLGLVGATDGDATFGLDITAPEVTIDAYDEWIVRADLSGGTIALDPAADGGTGAGLLTPDGRAALEQVTGLTLPGDEPEVLSDRWPQLMVVRDGGGWRVSPGHTVGEQWRVDEELREPMWGEGVIAVGSTTPDEVVPDLLRAYGAGDSGRMVSMAEPEESVALQQYATLAVPLWDGDLRRAMAEDGFFFRVDDIDVEVSGQGKRRTATVTSFDGAFGDDQTTVDLRYADGCLRITTTELIGDAEPTVEQRCDGELHDDLPDAGPWSELLALTALGRAFPTFSLAEHHGRWFISPTRTALGTLTEVAAGLEPDQADELVTALDAAWVWGPEAATDTG